MAISLEGFKQRITILSYMEAERIRTKYIDSFVNIATKYYKELIAQKKQFADGFYYVGYLWDSLKRVTPISKEEADQILMQKGKSVYVLWDLHSTQRIFIKNYWKFPKDAVLFLPVTELMTGMEFLPEDIYIFDDGFDWTIILTHEYSDDQKRLCLEARS